MSLASEYMNDFHYIKKPNSSDFIDTMDIYRFNQQSIKWLSTLEPNKVDLVITHHLPSYKSIAKKYQGSSLNPYFASNLDHLVRKLNPALWIHGHTHSNLGYLLGTTRIFCNPKGYDRENPDWNPNCIVELHPKGASPLHSIQGKSKFV